MKLHLLEAWIDRFIQKQLHSNDAGWHYPHSLVGHFHQTWVTKADLTLKEKYDWALKSEISQRWWKRENYRPKEIMLKLIDADPELASIAFKDLSNDAASLDGRLSRFNFYCEELLQLHRKNNIRDIETHHHQDAGIISLYLAGFFPGRYALYPGLDIFQSFCKAVGSPEITLVDDLVRYAKVAGIVFKFLEKKPLYAKVIEQRAEVIHRIPFIPFQAAYEIISFAGIDHKSPGR